MDVMKKYLIIMILLVNIANSSTTLINSMQEQFQRDVLELNVFKKRYGIYLNKQCGDDLLCYKNKIQILKSWETVQEDKKLLHYLEEKHSSLKYDKTYWDALILKLEKKDLNFTESQFVSVVDLKKQIFIITLWNQEEKKFYFIGQDFISSGNIKREKEIIFGDSHYLKTPTGIFTSENGWRSDGKKNEDNVTLGYGEKNRFIFYFGKQKSIRYNTFDKNKTKIKDSTQWKVITDYLHLAAHSHKSSKKMGEANSHGCVRMSDEMNRFLDNNYILHKNTLEANQWVNKYSKQPNYPKNSKYAGEYLIIFDNIN